MAPKWWNKPYEFHLFGIQLKTVHAHSAGDLFDAANKVTVEQRRVVWATLAGVLVRLRHLGSQRC